MLLLFIAALPGRLPAADIKVSQGISLNDVIKKASAGDTITISGGPYFEKDIHVDRPVFIRGENYPVIDGSKKHQLFVITADSVTITGLAIRNTGKSSMTEMAGVRISQSRGCQIVSNKFYHTTYGVLLEKSTNCIVSGNVIIADSANELNNGNGVHAWKCDSLRIEDNRISGHRDGIYFEFVTNSHIVRNVSTNNVRYGLHFMFSHNDVYEANTFDNNGAGVAVMYSKQVDMHGNTFRLNWGDASYAILLKDISDSRIERNLFFSNTVGIYMEGSSRIRVRENDFENNGWAIRVQASCDDNSFLRNNFFGNSFDVATNGTMMLNKFAGNYWDKYTGYDLDHDQKGDVPYYPVSVYAILSEKIPTAMILYRSFLTNIIDEVEKMMPSIIPDDMKDDEPRMKRWKR